MMSFFDITRHKTSKVAVTLPPKPHASRAYSFNSTSRVDLKAFRHAHGLRALTFATPVELLEMLGLILGAVTPFSLLNDQCAKIHLYIDSNLVKPNGLIDVHPNNNRATLWLKTDDLLALIRAHGNTISVVDIP